MSDDLTCGILRLVTDEYTVRDPFGNKGSKAEICVAVAGHEENNHIWMDVTEVSK